MSITIRRTQVTDAAAVAELMSDPEVFGGLLQLPFPSEEVWRQRLTEGTSPGKTDLQVVAILDEKLVGLASLRPEGTALRRRHAMSLGICVAAHAQGHGVGKALMAALLDYADNWAQVLRTELQVYCDNAGAIGLYKRFGFEIEGTMRAYALRNGQYVDIYAMARLHPNPPRWK
jgi:putative acetyltransferase